MSLTAATRAETTKQFTTSLWWILAIVLVVYVGFTASVLAVVFSASASGSLGDGPSLPEEGLAGVLYSTATAVGYVFPLLIGTLMVTTEFRHKTLTPTFLATPRRGRVLSAKLAVGVLMGALFGVIGVAASVGASASFLAAFGLDTAFGSPDTWAMIGRMLLAYVLWTLIGIGVGALVRNQVGAIVGVLVFTQFLEPIGRAAASFVEGLSRVTQYLPGAAGDALVGTSVFTMGVPDGAMVQLEWWAGALVLLGYAVVLIVLGQLLSWRRDVS
ncbi:ABC transporter permease [Microbacterium sp. HD4P20]|uniref:ABC transporter permease n=1 Tax=Microbacterium sp. HD4P20 TaxID=2864874 RepID=UPI001C64054E|nr:ABC transporter permease [Microbacterium sp. HD4P20]MCP2635765.1 ABC transporter permease [Microbacterium sp. HD4P20]